MDCVVHGVAKSWTQLSDFHFHFSGSESFGVEIQKVNIFQGPLCRRPLTRRPWVYSATWPSTQLLCQALSPTGWGLADKLSESNIDRDNPRSVFSWSPRPNQDIGACFSFLRPCPSLLWKDLKIYQNCFMWVGTFILLLLLLWETFHRADTENYLFKRTIQRNFIRSAVIVVASSPRNLEIQWLLCHKRSKKLG